MKKVHRNKNQAPARLRLNVLLSLVCIIFLGSCMKPVVGRSFQLSIDNGALESGRVVVSAKLTNNSEETLSLLSWNTPFDLLLSGAFFSVYEIDGEAEGPGRSDVTLSYLGIQVKRGNPKESDYLVIKQGESKANSLDLTKAYQFCPNVSYRIAFDGIFYDRMNSIVEVSTHSVEFDSGSAIESCNLQ